MDTWEKTELTALIRNTNLQFRSSGYSWQKNEKKNTGNCKALCVSHKCNNYASIDSLLSIDNENVYWFLTNLF